MAWLQTMHAEVICELGSAEGFASVARDWLSSCLPEVFPELDEGLRTRPVVRSKPHPKHSDLPWGQPGHVLGTLTTYREHPAFGGREVVYSDQAWQRMLDDLGSYPFAVRVAVTDLDSRGFPVHQFGGADVSAERDYYVPDWVSLTFSAAAVDTGWPGSAQTQDRWAEFVKAQAGRAGAVAGSMTDDIGPGQSALQRATLDLAAMIEDSRDVLRGYTWITIVAAGIAARLGGAAALAASGAFHEVSTLPNGSLWLRATPTINEFTGDRVRAVFEALAPELPAGTAEFRFSESFRIVEHVDAADYRQPRARPGQSPE